MVSHACAKTVSDKTAASETNPKNTPNDLRNEKQKLKLFPSNNNRILHCDLCENTKLDGCDWKIKLPKRREDFGDCQRDFGTDFVYETDLIMQHLLSPEESATFGRPYSGWTAGKMF